MLSSGRQLVPPGPDVRSEAFTVSADGRVIAAVDVSGPTHRLTTSESPALVQLTCAAAADLSRRLGYRTPIGT